MLQRRHSLCLRLHYNANGLFNRLLINPFDDFQLPLDYQEINHVHQGNKAIYHGHEA
jgi:hypothetical protein